jgi:transposase
MLAMVHSGFRSLSPAGLLINDVTIGPDRILITARCRAASSRCPNCGRRSEQVHSRYERRLLDLPSHGRAVEMRVAVRRFRCAEPSCQRRIFAEPLGDAVAGRSARRTSRLEAIVHHLGIALGGRPAAALARRLMLPVSKDTLLRVVRRHSAYDTSPLCVIGIDDWAWKRGQRYGSIICDLERRQVVDLLADREPATVEAWLSRHPEVRVISRDRGGGYGQAATRAAPRAIQVADRWHLMENASAAFLEAVRRSMRPIRIALGSTTIDPDLLTHAERLQHEGYLRREEAYGIIRALAKAGTPIKEIVRRTGRSRKLVREIARGGGGDVFCCRSNVLKPHLAWLDAEWSAGCRNGAELWRRLQTRAGFRGSLRVVAEWATRRRRAESTGCETLRKPPSGRVLSRLLLSERDQLTKGDAIIVARIERDVPVLVSARDLVERFHRMARDRDPAALPAWIGDAAGSVLASFGKGIVADRAAVAAAMTQPWSNGQTEGQITKLKLVKRQMYGRAKLDLLRARLLAPA